MSSNISRNSRRNRTRRNKAHRGSNRPTASASPLASNTPQTAASDDDEDDTHFGMFEGIWELHDGDENDCSLCQCGDTVSALDFIGSARNAGAALAEGKQVDFSQPPANLRRLARGGASRKKQANRFACS